MAKSARSVSTEPLTEFSATPICLDYQQLAEAKVSEDGDRTVSFIVSDETPVMRSSWFRDHWYLVLSHDPKHVRLDRVTSGACMFLESHNGYDGEARIGKIIDAKISGKQLKLTARINTLEAGNRYFQEVQDKCDPPKSVGAAVYEMETVEPALYEEDEDGYKKLIRPATLRAIDWELLEASVCNVSANPNSATKESFNLNAPIAVKLNGNSGMDFPIQKLADHADLKTGDFVEWSASGGKAQGKIQKKAMSGTVKPEPDGDEMEGSADEPAFLIANYTKSGEKWKPSGVKTAHRAATLTKIEPLKTQGKNMPEDEKKRVTM
jgi:Hypervirulence associated proteins TUDOR domain